MRIIAGEYKGRRLETPSDDSVRPTTDKVKEAMFSILSEQIRGSAVLDLFAGTGSLGLEALSRGADKCTFCDNSRNSMSIVKKNIEKCRADEYAEVIASDFKRFLMKQEEGFDVILMDPPYGKGLLKPAFELIEERKLLNAGGTIVAEHGTDEDMPDEMCGFHKFKDRRYGAIMLSIYR